MWWIIGIVVVLVVFGGYFIGIYNGLVRKRNQ